MAETTDPALRQRIIYSVFVRNHTPEGTFKSLAGDLGRIKALGCDYIWLMPIHPIGKENRKGTLGSPYANQDYRAINPEYGTLEDFEELVDAIHAAGMKVMIDVVYNHTSPDSVLWHEHPEFFYHKPDGKPGNHIGEWSDVIDLDYTVAALWDYQIETLSFWARLVDGFRCDVASFVSVEFWKKAREAIHQIKPDFVWLAETVYAGFGDEVRARGMYCATDEEDYEAFDIEYEYDIRETFEACLKGAKPLSAWAHALNAQETSYPASYDKLRFLENHDTERIASLVPDRKVLRALAALVYYLKGTTLIYGGEETEATARPSLFDKDTVLWDWKAAELDGRDLSPLMERMAEISHTVLGGDDLFHAEADDAQRVLIARRDGTRPTIGVFPLSTADAAVALPVPDGSYQNLIDGSTADVAGGRLLVPAGHPCIIEA